MRYGKRLSWGTGPAEVRLHRKADTYTHTHTHIHTEQVTSHRPGNADPHTHIHTLTPLLLTKPHVKDIEPQDTNI